MTITLFRISEAGSTATTTIISDTLTIIVLFLCLFLLPEYLQLRQHSLTNNSNPFNASLIILQRRENIYSKSHLAEN